MDTHYSPYPYGKLLRTFAVRLRPYRWRFWLGSALRISADIGNLYSSYMLAKAVAFFVTYHSGGTLHDFWPLLFAWSGAVAYATVSRQLAKYFCYGLGLQVSIDSQLAGIEHLQLLDIAWHEKENTGNKLKRIENGGEAFEKLLRIWIDNILEITVNFIGMIIIIAFIDKRVACIMAVFLVTYQSLSIYMSRKAIPASRLQSELEEDFSGSSFETLNNIRSVKVMGMFAALKKLLIEQKNKVVDASYERLYRFRFKSAAQRLWAYGFQTVIFIFIAYGIQQGHFDIAFLVLFNFYFNSLHTSAMELTEISMDVAISRYRIARLEHMLAEPIRLDDNAGKVNFPKQWKKIELKNVTFAYGDNVVLKDLNLVISRGERIGIVGLSGSGKSTLFKLLLKEYENFSGDILFDDVSIRSIKKSSFIRHVAVVLQDTEVFNFSLRDNITLANMDDRGSLAKVKAAIKTAHVADFMDKLPDGLETIIGEKGIKLSGGEKQRVGIARAIFKQPDLLFLDEATSHLDLESEEKIQDSLHTFFKDVTAVVIAHRLTTIQEMDRILLIEGGRLIEEGDFQTLHNKRGRFFDLWEKQKI